MKKKLEMLEDLQEIDTRIDTLKNARNTLYGEVATLEQGVDTARQELAALRSAAEKLEQEKAGLENRLAAEQANIRRSEANMKEIKTNKEFQAVGREITAARKVTVELEDQILQKVSQLETLTSDIGTKTAGLDELERNSAQYRDEKLAEVEAISQDIEHDERGRAAITGELPASLVKRYDNLRQQRRGQAIAFARDGYCLGCNMNLPPQLYNSLFRCDELISCPHCQRVLILKQQ